jgi:Predicted membrane protein (DUF2254)
MAPRHARGPGDQERRRRRSVKTGSGPGGLPGRSRVDHGSHRIGIAGADDPDRGVDLLVTLTSVVLSLTLVAVQLAMGQFSPRIVRATLHDRRSQLAVGLFIGTFAYSMTVLAGPWAYHEMAVVDWEID